MPTCQFPDCTEDTPSKMHKYCLPHREQVTREQVKSRNEKFNARRRNAEIYYCRFDGCETVVANGSVHYCEKHRKVKSKEWKRKTAERMAMNAAQYDQPINPPWEPKPKAPPILTDAEQRKIDAEILMRERLRCGCTHSPVRLLSREEIEQLQHQYQPAKYVREEVILPWSKRCAAEPKGTSLRRP